jgi:hypothetical protein
MNPIVEQTAVGSHELREDQRTTVSELVESYCQRFGGTPAQLAQAASLDAGRFSSYLDGRGVDDLTTAEMTAFMTLCSRLEGKAGK